MSCIAEASSIWYNKEHTVPYHIISQVCTHYIIYSKCAGNLRNPTNYMSRGASQLTPITYNGMCIVHVCTSSPKIIAYCDMSPASHVIPAESLWIFRLHIVKSGCNFTIRSMYTKHSLEAAIPQLLSLVILSQAVAVSTLATASSGFTYRRSCTKSWEGSQTVQRSANCQLESTEAGEQQLEAIRSLKDSYGFGQKSVPSPEASPEKTVDFGKPSTCTQQPINQPS